MKKMIAAALVVLVLLGVQAGDKLWWEPPAPAEVHHVRVYYSTNDQWWLPSATWIYSKSVTNPPVGPFTNRITGVVTNLFFVTISNSPPTLTAGRVAYVSTNGSESPSSTYKLMPPTRLRIESD